MRCRSQQQTYPDAQQATTSRVIRFTHQHRPGAAEGVIRLTRGVIRLTWSPDQSTWLAPCACVGRFIR